MWGEARSRSVRGGGEAHGERRVDILAKSKHFAFPGRVAACAENQEKGGVEVEGESRWRHP
eukprot:2823452-Prymnesium_polylepis.1